MSKFNGEVRARGTAKSMILGKAKVMSFEALEEVRAKRAAKEAAAVEKAVKVRKRKTLTTKAGGPGTKAGVIGVSGAPGPWRAPVARIIAEDWC